MARKLMLYIAHLGVAICGMLLCWSFFVQVIRSNPPIAYMASEVWPSFVRPGEVVNVRREYKVLRPNYVVSVTRELVQAQCVSKCLVYELAPSIGMNQDGGIIDRTRAMQIPTYVRPGKYTLRFTLHWEQIGLKHSMRMPELQIEVVP